MPDLSPDQEADWERVVQNTKLGVYDGRLQEIMEAIQFRAAGGATAFRWKLTLEDVEVTEDNVTLGELVDIEKELDVSWVSINPARSAQQCATILRVCVATRSDLSEDAAKEKVDALTAGDILDLIDQYEVVRPPLEQDQQPTT